MTLGGAFAAHDEHFTVSPNAIIFGDRGPSLIDGLRLLLRSLLLRSLRLSIIIHITAVTVFSLAHVLLLQRKDEVNHT